MIFSSRIERSRYLVKLFVTPNFIYTPSPHQTVICRRFDDIRVKWTSIGVIRDQIWQLDPSTIPHDTSVRLIWEVGAVFARYMLHPNWNYKSMADGLGLMKQYGTFSNTAPVLLQRPSDDTRNLQLHWCISMPRTADPSSDLRTNSTIATLWDDLSSTIVIRAGSGAASPGIPFQIGYTTYSYQTYICRRWNRRIIP